MALDGGTVVIDVQAKFNNGLSPGIDNADKKVDKFEESIRKAIEELNRLTKMHPSLQISDKASGAIVKAMNSIRQFSGKTFKSTIKVIDYATKPLRAIKDTLFSLKGVVSMVVGGMAMNKAIMQPIGLADAYSSAKIGFSTLLGDEAGQAMMDEIDRFAKETPFKTSGVISNVQKMMAYGWDTSRIIDDMKTIGDAAAATGKGDEGLASIVYALSEIRSKGRLSTQELANKRLGSQGHNCEKPLKKTA